MMVIPGKVRSMIKNWPTSTLYVSVVVTLSLILQTMELFQK